MQTLRTATQTLILTGRPPHLGQILHRLLAAALDPIWRVSQALLQALHFLRPQHHSVWACLRICPSPPVLGLRISSGTQFSHLKLEEIGWFPTGALWGDSLSFPLFHHASTSPPPSQRIFCPTPYLASSGSSLSAQRPSLGWEQSCPQTH